MARIVDVDRGDVLGRWICENPECGAVLVSRTHSKWTRPPQDPGERCSCQFCCFSPADRGGTMKWHPEVKPSNVIQFPSK